MIKILPILSMRLHKMRDRRDILLQRSQELPQRRLILRLVARGREGYEVAQMVELLFKELDLEHVEDEWGIHATWIGWD